MEYPSYNTNMNKKRNNNSNDNGRKTMMSFLIPTKEILLFYKNLT